MRLATALSAALQSVGGAALAAGALLPWTEVRANIAGSAPRADLDTGIESGLGKAFVGLGAALVAIALLRPIASSSLRRPLGAISLAGAGAALAAAAAEAVSLHDRVGEFGSSVEFLGGEAAGAVRPGIAVAIAGAAVALGGAIIALREWVGSEEPQGGSHGSGR